MKLSTVLMILGVAAIVLTAACGLFNAAAAATGNERAATPEAQELARQADEAFLRWQNFVWGAGAIILDRTQKKVRGVVRERRARTAASRTGGPR